MNFRTFLLTSALAAAFLAGSEAQATQVIKTLDLVASDFTPPSFDPVRISFSIDFDNASSFSRSYDKITLISSNTVGPLQIGYLSVNDSLWLVGGAISEAYGGGCAFGRNGFCVVISNISSNFPTGGTFQMWNSSQYSSSPSKVTMSSSSSVPEPATWAMMMVGLGTVGFAMRRQRQHVRMTYA